MDLQFILNTPQRRRPPSEIPETPQFRHENLPLHTHSVETSRDDRIAINTALLFDIPHPLNQQKLKVTERQIQYAKDHRPTPQKAHSCQDQTCQGPKAEDHGHPAKRPKT